VREGVTEGAVGEEKIVKAGLGEHVASGRDGRGAGAGGWAELATELETFEEAAPDGLDRGGIGFPLFV